MRARVSVAALAAAVTALLASTAATAGTGTEAVGFLRDVVRGRDSAVVARFDPQMRSLLTASQLRAAWAKYQRVFGRYLSHGSPQLVPVTGATVVRIPLRMARRRGEFRIAFRSSDGLIAGLYFLRTGVPL